MSDRTGLLVAFIMTLWLAVYVGTGTMERHHDEIATALWIAFMGSILFLAATERQKGKR